jgi:membrane protein DedA with SNARE-associated domain
MRPGHPSCGKANFMLPDLQLDHISYLGIIVVLVLTGSGLPVPEEVPIIAAGIASSVGTLEPWWAFLSCLVGALLGDSVLYAIGYHFGHSLVTRHPRFAHLVHAEYEAKIEQMIRRHGLKVFFLARFMVGIRAPVYLTAGILRMSFRRFLLIDAFCATCVVGLFFGLSYAYGRRVAGWIRDSEIGLSVLAIIAAVAVLCVFLWRRRRRQRLEPAMVEPPETCVVGADDPSQAEALGEPSGIRAPQ